MRGASGGGRRRRARGRQNGRVVWEPAPASRPGGVGGRPRRVQRRRTAATWPAPGGARRAPRARERGEGGAGRAAQLGQKGGGSAQQRLPPFLFFLKFLFSKILSKFIWTNLKSFSPLAPKNKVVPKQKLYHFALTSKTKFQTEFELQVKTQF